MQLMLTHTTNPHEPPACLRACRMQIPDVTLQLAAPGGSCRTVRLRDQAPRDNRSGWQKFTLSLQQFDWRNSNPDPSSGNAFGGCSDSVNDWSVDTLMIQNAWGGDQYLCIDQVGGGGVR